ncbi:hypothetical protein [Flavobacterium aquidurense]|uniref:hypothetical protein n=1 Tax=Flavobacterium aquidurense TaxID=362413 RepID=UPI00286709F9|nr:hypothetical protein [Flavobacterium aquidurense]MDR7369566.1 hypothetical protein [Flavobacterium aquidurense]
MKRILLLVILGISLNLHAQTATAEKSIFGAQAGFIGLWINNESRLVNNFVLRSEVGIEHDIAVGDQYEGAGFIFQPVLTIEPKLYYNLNKRSQNGKNISKNSGNYVSLKTSYHPDWFVLNLDDNITKTADLSIVPTWGFRRVVGEHFTYEGGAGLGYRIVFLKPNYYNGVAQNVDDSSTNRNQYTPYFHVRLGYTF